jgi:hypothetical protein
MLNDAAARTREWKLIILRRSRLRMALASPIWARHISSVSRRVVLSRDQHSLFGVPTMRVVVHTDDRYLVVGRQFALNRLTEAQAMEDGAEPLVIIH